MVKDGGGEGDGANPPKPPQLEIVRKGQLG